MGINAAELLCKIINNPGMKEENLRLPVRSISGMTVAKIN
jgi:DNA-binding LacI/PurR family transcriptional regulator